MPSLSKSLKAYGGWFSGLIGGFLIGFGIIALIFAPVLIRANEAWTNEINDILNTWRSLHPNDIVPIAQTPSEAYYAYANLQLYGAIVIFIGVFFGALGFYGVYSSLKMRNVEKEKKAQKNA